MPARPAKRSTFRAIPMMPACCFAAWPRRDELASNDPLLFRELQALCTLCRSKERCVLDLAQECDEPGNQGWREYCLNATTLNALGAVENCARAAQYLRTPRSTGYVATE